MKKYYLHDGIEKLGPFDISELKSKNITPNTNVWHKGLEDWTKAEQIEELTRFFKDDNPPPFKGTNKIPKVNRQKSVSKAMLIVAGLIGVFIIIRFLVRNNDYEPSYFQQKMTLEETEESEPLRFLNIEGNYNESFWGTKFKLRGKVTNEATIADYKDIVIRITFYSKTKSAIGTKDYTIYQVFPPNRVTEFKLDVDNYEGVNSIGLELIDAVPNI